MKVLIIIAVCITALCACSQKPAELDDHTPGPARLTLSAHGTPSTAQAIAYSQQRLPGLTFQQQDAGAIGLLHYAALQSNGVHLVVNIYADEDPDQELRALKLLLRNKQSAQSAAEVMQQLVQPFASQLFTNGDEIWQHLQASPPIEGIQHIDIASHGISLDVAIESNQWQHISYDLISIAEQEAMRERFFK
ncbi:MAG: hypothetical protein ACI9QL_002356 [Candidatus Omnitrophota bacterium]|jgi:hypothetical protein